jgi:hypothetical protein
MLFEYNELKFEWDENKNQANIKKHGISFKEAASVFSDIDSVFLPDPKHSYGEERFILIGLSDDNKILAVCHCERNENNHIRIISAWKATNKEKNIYKTGGMI